MPAVGSPVGDGTAGVDLVQQGLGTFGWQVFLHELQQAVALHKGRRTSVLGLVESDIPLQQCLGKGGLIPRLAFGHQGHHHGLVFDKGFLVGLLLPTLGEPFTVRRWQGQNALVDRLSSDAAGKLKSFMARIPGLTSPLANRMASVKRSNR